MKALPLSSPCAASWSSMTPMAGGRFCAACTRPVHDLAGATERRVLALRLLYGATGLCVRQVVDERGELVLAAERRAPRAGWVAGAVALALLSPTASAQEPSPAPVEQIDPGSMGGIDTVDSCPGVGSEAETGCPPLVRVELGGAPMHVKSQVYFARGSTALDADDLLLVREVAHVMNDHPEIRLVAVYGHGSTDEGSKAKALGQRRAEAVRDAIVASGVDPARLVVGSWGTTRPIGDPATPEGRALNRAVEFMVCEEGTCSPSP